MSANPFYPSADAGTGYGKGDISLPSRPLTISPILDAISSTEPLASFDTALFEQAYVGSSDDGTSKMPTKPDGFPDPYLYPMLTRNERLRLTMLWYYTRDLTGDERTLRKMQAKVDLLKSLVGWEFAICGLLENDIYQRLATVGLPLALLPRRESTCAHTVQQPAGSVFFVSDMSDDWRFAQSPHVSQGGLRAYAGAQLRCQVDDGQELALGSLCIASNVPGRTLSPSQLDLLVHFADMLTEDIIDGSRRKRAKQQERNDELLREAFTDSFTNPTDDAVMGILGQVFSKAQISVVPITGCSVHLHVGGAPVELPGRHVKSAIWEDSDLIDELIRTNNHQRLKATQPVRAIIGVIKDKPTDRALVVSTIDITHIFDDIDVRFVEGCAMVLRSVAQERSLQDALRTRERFMRGITHQLRTPIHGILGSVDLLAGEIARTGRLEGLTKSTSDTVSENLKMIKSSGRDLMSTVNNVIKFNRWTESIGSSMTATLGDLDRLESAILEEVSWLLPEGHLDCVSTFFNNILPAGVNNVQIDMTLLKDCLQSLVLNALQNTTRGSVIVTISAASDCTSIMFDVRDTGCGIGVADRHRIFDAYEKGNSHSTGAGLGLTLACKIAGVLGGAVTLISSTIGGGSHFRVAFPNPGFACLKNNTRAAVTRAITDLPRRFAIIPPKLVSMLDEHFVHFLGARGFQASHDVEGEDERKAKESHPHVLFFSGPFTSGRLDEILLETRDTYMARTPTEPTSSSETGTEAEPRSASGFPSSILSSRNSSIALSDSAPNCLLVDDNLINLRILSMYCDKRKFPYTSAIDGLQAIDRYKDAVKGTPISLILLDLQMPNCDGIQACEAIRAFEEKECLSPAVIFIVTGQDSPSDRTKALEAGADNFFVKPVSLKSLDRGIAETFRVV